MNTFRNSFGAALIALSLATPVLANTTITSSSTSCWRGTCTTETKTTLPEQPAKPNTGYLPNFSGIASSGSTTAHSETLYFPARSAAAPIDPKCRKVNACLVIHPGNEGAHGFVRVR